MNHARCFQWQNTSNAFYSKPEALGKMLAYLIPLVARLVRQRKPKSDSAANTVCPRVLIVFPTRELAIQVFEPCILYGGGDIGGQTNQLRRAVSLFRQSWSDRLQYSFGLSLLRRMKGYHLRKQPTILEKTHWSLRLTAGTSWKQELLYYTEYFHPGKGCSLIGLPADWANGFEPRSSNWQKFQCDCCAVGD